MRSIVPEKLEAGRIRDGAYGSTPDYGLNGAFFVVGPNGTELAIIGSDGVDSDYNWEHVSVSTKRRTPNWNEMCFVKNLFWQEDECVVQFHPPKSDYVNCHPFCLHLWKPIRQQVPMPPAILVGPK
jgi:hypothetical protein